TNRLISSLSSFPTRRSSDLYVDAMDTHGEDGLGESYLPEVSGVPIHDNASEFINQTLADNPNLTIIALGPLTNIALAHQAQPDRSEEHTSELQSRFDLVCRL